MFSILLFALLLQQGLEGLGRTICFSFIEQKSIISLEEWTAWLSRWHSQIFKFNFKILRSGETEF